MSFLYNGEEKYCPFYFPGREIQTCRRAMCLAFEVKTEFYELEHTLERFRVSYCHALKKDLDVEKVEEGSEPSERE